MTQPIDIVINVTGNAGQQIDSLAATIQKRLDSIKVDKAQAAMDYAFNGPADAPEKLNQQLDEQNEKIGLSRREWSRLGSEAVYYVSDIAGKTGGLSKEIVGAIDVTKELGMSFMFGGAAGAAVALVGIAVGAIASELQKTQKAAEDAEAPFKKIEEDVTKLIKLEGLDKAAKDLGVTRSALEEYAKSSADAGNNTLSWSIASEQLAGKQVELAQHEEALKTAQDKLAASQELAKNSGLDLEHTEFAETDTVTVETQKVAELKDEIAKLSAGQSIMADTVKTGTEKLAEQNRLWDAAKTAIPQMRSEVDAYTQSLQKLSDAHTKAQTGFQKDALKIEATYTEDRNKINADSLQKLADLELQHTEKLSDDYYAYAKNVESLEGEITKSSEDEAQKREEIERNARQSIIDLDRSTGQKLKAAKTEHDRDTILEDAAISRAGLLQKANSDLQSLNTSKAKQDEEFTHKRELIDEEYRHTKEIAGREEKDAVDRIQRETRQQLDDSRKRRDQQISDINARSQDEIASYKTSVAEATKAHNTKMKQLSDLRTADQKLADDMAVLSGTAWDPWIQKVKDYKTELDGLTSNSETVQWSGGGTYRPANSTSSDTSSGWRDVGAGTVINASFVISGARDPKTVAREVQGVLNNAMVK